LPLERPQIWYFDKAGGAIVFLVGITLGLVGLFMAYVYWESLPDQSLVPFVVLTVLAALACLYIGIILFKRAGENSN
jgi:divalent metal cation (Fe/Co/Zn/Cd) transporter